jgi:mannose-6-phosphate isomerase-like protein (cupin superfamily)
MARVGQRIYNRVTNHAVVFRKTAAETDGSLLRVELQPGPGVKVPLHIHREQEERFRILEGHVHIRVGNEVVVCGPGETAVCPPDTPHQYWNEGSEPARLISEFLPALDAEGLYETLFGLGHDGKVDRRGVPRNPLQTAVLIDGFPREFFYLPYVPVRLQRALSAPLARLGRWFGLDHRYARYAALSEAGSAGAVADEPLAAV